MFGWALLADAVALYPLYALLFADTGLSDAEISLLFAIWSVVGIVAEVPTGALADRFSRRTCLVASGVLQAAGFALWTAAPGFGVFAAGFVLWGLGGVLASGAQEALLYDGLVAAGAQRHYAAVNGRISAAELAAQLPAAGLATLLFPLGGYVLVGWVSVATCLAAAFVASTIPEAPRAPGDDDESGYLDTLRDGLRIAASRPGVPGVVAAAALVTSVDGVEEYFPLLVASWGVPVALVPVADLPIVLGGMAGAALAGRAAGLRAGWLAALLAVSMVLFAGAGIVAHPAGIVGVVLFYGGYRAVLAVTDARLQDRIDSASRATVTSVAGMGADVATIGLYALWALGGVTAVAVTGLLLAALLPALLRAPRP
ncbi:MFS transporter [Pseudonocardia hydrocarbonoxydans]|uniref:MFS transporter n=1 Tax=Pseudonocardia hydrocarbonoxydans TaxID=76726 RepID=A0A4Y3WTL1_9PSEU|nr:MFS transporter [Pseudonocardia hydrocarbonoxydans]GEC22104.1 MFS transporter [Pseudonocardia hydrocarbonoxydans]